MSEILVVDAHDSFIHIISQYFSDLRQDPTVVRIEDINNNTVLTTDAIVLGPGPGHPSDSGYLELLEVIPVTTPVLGICLGHQAIGISGGAGVRHAASPMHGKLSHVAHDGEGCFTGIPQDFSVARYHSLVVVDDSYFDDYVVSARVEGGGEIMGLRHKSRPIECLQFHPESIGTEWGHKILANFLNCYVSSQFSRH